MVYCSQTIGGLILHILPSLLCFFDCFFVFFCFFDCVFSEFLFFLRSFYFFFIVIFDILICGF
ncbi:hypothetical protein D8B45_00995 [Candidatus Gracilibacteria bacterium]|nr:MAG: hypothetical protein D8B45_04855 [Candidatus Gracilibacteria bacterium]RKW25269.1 MAG: hypothetical protein D8B45_00995 [Candidatus Gracilibacteria bacterium]